MNRDGIIEFLSALGIQQHTVEGEWLQASCPLAFSRHKYGRDSKPSFGIITIEDGKSGYHCFACGLKGHDLGDLLIEIQHEAKQHNKLAEFDLAKARAIVEQENDIGYVAHDWTDASLTKQFEAWPDWWLERHPAAWQFDAARKYLIGRGVSANVCKSLDLRFDAKRSMVGFPIRHESSMLAGFRGRSIAGKQYHDYVWNGVNNTAVVLYGESWLNPLLPVVVVEGPFDLAAVYPHYRNVCAIFMASINKRKLAKLELAVQVLVMTDNDLAGEQVFWAIRDHIPETQRVKFPEEQHDPGSMTPDQVRTALSAHVKLT